MATATKVKLNNPALLKWARMAAGYGLDDVASAVQKPTETVAAWEAGVEAPTYRQLQKLARKVRRPVAVLFLPEIPDVPGPPEDFRTLPNTIFGSYAPESLLAFRELRNSMRWLRDILDELGEPLRLKLPEWTGLQAPATARASELRDHLGITFEQQLTWRGESQPLNEWRDVLFNCGVLTQVFSIPLQDARGFSLLAHELGGVGLSSSDASKAKSFSLIHEVVHLCLRRPGVSGDDPPQTTHDAAVPHGESERYCDAVAAEFLLPVANPVVAEAMENLARAFKLSTARSLASKFSVSKYVIARHLFELGMVEPDRYWDAWESWREQDRVEAAVDARRKKERREGGPDSVRVKVSHAGRRYVAKVFEAMTRGVVSTHEASRILSLRPESFDKAFTMLS